MEYSHYDKEMANEYGINNLFKKKKKVAIAKPTGGTNPEAVTVNGVPMVKTSTKSKKQVKKAKRKANRKKVLGKIGKGLKKGIKAVAKVSKGLALAPMLAPIVPLKPMMKKALTKKGFKAPKKTQDLAEAFYNHIIKGKANYDTPELNYDGYQDNFITVEIVGQILKFVKDAIGKKKLKKSGEVPGLQLSPVEELVANDSEKVVKEIEAKAGEMGISQEQIIPLPGSNAKESNDSGVAPEEKRGKNRGKGKGKGKDKKGGMFAGISTPLLIGGAAAGVYLLTKLSK
jgi:hypothetical protein